MDSGNTEECAAVCSACKNSTGKIYEGYVCADCRITALEELAETGKYYREMYEKEQHEFIAFRESCEGALEYKTAFQLLVKEMTTNKEAF